MAKSSGGSRVIALVIAVVLITGGITTLGSHAIAVSKVFACLAILAGVMFLGKAARSA